RETKSGDYFSLADVSGLHRRSDDSTMLASVSPSPGWPPHEGQTLGQRTQLVQGPSLSHELKQRNEKKLADGNVKMQDLVKTAASRLMIESGTSVKIVKDFGELCDDLQPLWNSRNIGSIFE